MAIEIRPVTRAETKEYLRVLPYVNGLPQEDLSRRPGTPVAPPGPGGQQVQLGGVTGGAGCCGRS